MSPYRYRWIILLACYICILVFAFTLQSLPPVLPLIIEEMNLTHAEAGLLMSLFTFPSIFLAILAGILSDRLGAFRVGITSLLLVIGGTLFIALSQGFPFVAFGRLVSGTGAATISIVAAKTLSHWFQGREIGSAMGIYNTAMPVGTIICFTTFGRLGESLGWRFPLFISLIISVLGLAAFLLLYKRAPNTPQIKPNQQQEEESFHISLFHVMSLIWVVALCWLWFNAATIGFFTFGPDFYVSNGSTIGYAGFLTSLLMWGSLCLSPIIGRLIDKFNNNNVFIGAGGLMLSIAFFLVTKSTSFLFPVVIMAVAAALVPTPVFSFLSKYTPPKDLGLGFGILGMVSGIGMFFGPYLSGLIRDKTGSYETTFIFLAVLALLIPATAVILKIKTQKA
jgi:MFS family permease